MIEGFIYAAEGELLFEGAAPGSRVRQSVLVPPWTVVDHRLSSVLVTRWPGRLLRVRIPEPQGEHEQATFAEANSNLVQPPSYTRAFEVEILENLPVALLFGQHGEAVIPVIEAAHALDEATAHALTAWQHPDADHAYSDAWGRWLTERDLHSQVPGDSVLLFSPSDVVGSPIGMGLSLIYSEVRQAALRTWGERALTPGEGEEVLVSPWNGADAALLHAALALGAPEYVTDAKPLLAAWRAVCQS